ncbi:unnamed protein product [Meloidogyne enterolobii]|uniref:Uncharacterized protein n=1 Tax=Meloidogyne enterolobii TaxID=390850 RepID=A0ACB0ZXC2_MELEN
MFPAFLSVFKAGQSSASSSRRIRYAMILDELNRIILGRRRFHNFEQSYFGMYPTWSGRVWDFEFSSYWYFYVLLLCTSYFFPSFPIFSPSFSPLTLQKCFLNKNAPFYACKSINFLVSFFFEKKLFFVYYLSAVIIKKIFL